MWSYSGQNEAHVYLQNKPGVQSINSPRCTVLLFTPKYDKLLLT